MILSNGEWRRNPSPPPPRLPPKERRPSQQTALLSHNPVNPLSPKSPVRRKPVPVAASPHSASRDPPAVTPLLDSQHVAVPAPLSVRSFSNGVKSYERPQNNSAENQYSLFPGPLLSKNNSTASASVLSSLRARKESKLARSDTSKSLPHISTQEFPKPPSGRTIRPSRSNGALEELNQIVEDMGLKSDSRPPPLRTDSTSSNKSQPGSDKKPPTPGRGFASFFTRRPAASPTAESPTTDLSDPARSAIPSPRLSSPNASGTSVRRETSSATRAKRDSQNSIDFDFDTYLQAPKTEPLAVRCETLEAELREISVELAGSIKREMDLEDMVERLQMEATPNPVTTVDRTSDYFSDSGTSSIRPGTTDYNPKDEIEKIKRESEQQRAQIKADLSQRWQTELTTRNKLESQVQALQQRLSQSRSSDHSTTRARELEVALEDSKRRFNAEKQTNENFEDLLSALREDLEEHRNQRDNLRDEVVPQLKVRIEGLEASLAEAQKSSYDIARMQHELQNLRDENAALNNVRMMNAQIDPIAEENDAVTSPRSSFFGSKGGVQRSNTFGLGRSNSRSGLVRSNSTSNRGQQPESPRDVAEQLKAMELQRDALHSTVRYLLKRQEQQNKQFEKRLKLAEAERKRPTSVSSTASTPRRGGYEREVRSLRSEINILRKRADDALEQKWQCEKGLASLKMDLDRSKQETESLHRLLENRDSNAPEALSSDLEQALSRLQQQREEVGKREPNQSAERSRALFSQVKIQQQANSSLRDRLKEAIKKGERDQQVSTAQINELQNKLRKLEDVITTAQMQSETAVMKHEEEIHLLRASHNAQLMRGKPTNLVSNIFVPTARSPLSPLFSNSNKSPKLDKTSTGPGIALHQSLSTEYLENKVAELERALTDAEKEMSEVIGRMNTAQIGVAELATERDEALRKSRKLEAEIAAEREKVQQLINS